MICAPSRGPPQLPMRQQSPRCAARVAVAGLTVEGLTAICPRIYTFNAARDQLVCGTTASTF
jgi:hypothetical protein